MLAAFKNTTVTHLQQNIVKLKNLELQYWFSTFRTLTTQSSLLTGFSFAAMRASAYGNINEFLNITFLGITACSMGFGLMCISTASLCLMFGTEKALMGNQGALSSMDTAISMLKIKSQSCFYYFVAQLVFFHLSSFLLMWILYNEFVALIINFILGFFLVYFTKNGYNLFDSLYTKEEDATTNDFVTATEIFNRQRVNQDIKSEEELPEIQRGGLTPQQVQRRQNVPKLISPQYDSSLEKDRQAFKQRQNDYQEYFDQF